MTGAFLHLEKEHQKLWRVRKWVFLVTVPEVQLLSWEPVGLELKHAHVTMSTVLQERGKLNRSRTTSKQSVIRHKFGSWFSNLYRLVALTSLAPCGTYSTYAVSGWPLVLKGKEFILKITSKINVSYVALLSRGNVRKVVRYRCDLSVMYFVLKRGGSI